MLIISKMEADDRINEGTLCEWKKHSSSVIADYKIFKIVRSIFENIDHGKSGEFFIAKCDNWVQVVAETPEGRLVLVKQFRFGSEEVSLELPGGRIEPDEDPITAAWRELEEETGYCGDSAEILATLRPNAAIQDNIVHSVLIKNCVPTKATNFDEFEDLLTVIYSKKQLIDSIKSGAISHCITISAMTNYLFQSE